VGDIFDKLKILYWMLLCEFSNWQKYVLAKDLDSAFCCNGAECCCGGMTVRESFDMKPYKQEQPS
jgi:hypothetical protein